MAIHFIELTDADTGYATLVNTDALAAVEQVKGTTATRLVFSAGTATLPMRTMVAEAYSEVRAKIVRVRDTL